MIFSWLDIGPSHPYPAPQVGQSIGSLLLEGSRTVIWPRGQTVEKEEVTFWATAWQAIGGQAAGSFAALRYLLRQIEEFASNPDLQPAYVQLTSTAAAGSYNTADPHDGWYVLDNVQPDYTHNIVGGLVPVRASLSQVLGGFPSLLSAAYSGAALSTGYSAAATPLIGFPVGSSVPPTLISRAGAEGTIPLAQVPLSGSTNPVPFTPPSTIAGLYTGQVRAWDNLVAGSAPPTNGAYVSPSWVEVFGTAHDFVGDLVITNGLLLLRFQKGAAVSPQVWLWNTSLGTPAWQSLGSIQYQDNAGNIGNTIAMQLDKLGPEEARVKVLVATSAGNYAWLKYKLQRGMYHAYLEFWPIGYANSSKLALTWSTAAAYATGFTDSASSTTFPQDFGTTTTSGYFGVQGSATNSPVFGFLYQAIPGGLADQGYTSSSTLFGLGDSNGPGTNSFSRYGIWGAPYSGAPAVATAQGIAAAIFQQFLFDRSVRWARG